LYCFTCHKNPQPAWATLISNGPNVVEAAITDQLRQHPARWVVWAIVSLIAIADCLNVVWYPVAGLTWIIASLLIPSAGPDPRNLRSRWAITRDQLYRPVAAIGGVAIMLIGSSFF
jgi:hypothetical protein